MAQSFHVCIDVRGVLRNWDPEIWRGVKTKDGRLATPAEVMDWFLDELAEGRKVVPFGEPCEGFDYGGGGCPGHEVEAVASSTEGGRDG